MNEENTHAIVLRVACRLFGLCKSTVARGAGRSFAAKASRALFIATCRASQHSATPGPYPAIVRALGRTDGAISHLVGYITGKPGRAVCELAVRLDDALDGGPCRPDTELALAALREVAPELAVGVENEMATTHACELERRRRSRRASGGKRAGRGVVEGTPRP